MSNQINLSSFHSVLLYKRSYNASLRTSIKINCNCNNVNGILEKLKKVIEIQNLFDLLFEYMQNNCKVFEINTKL